MKRVLKFRAWNPETKKMVDDFTMHSSGINPYPDSPIMQFTGRQDRNGIDIYEDDVVHYAVKERICRTCASKEIREGLKFKNVGQFCPTCGTQTTREDFVSVAKVIFNKGSFAYYKEYTNETCQSWPVNIAEIYIEWVEVIGNIHANPDLFKIVEYS